jgi:hypothetical protein
VQDEYDPPRGKIRSVIGYVANHSPEILAFGGLANGLVVGVLYFRPAWRSWPVYLAWAAVFSAYILIAHSQDDADIAAGAEREPWRTLVGMQLATVVLAWVLLS